MSVGTITHTDAGTIYRDTDGNVLVWDRVLTEREARMIMQNPYQIFTHQTPSRGFRWWHRLLHGLRTVIALMREPEDVP
jgi:hypothetical protein